MWRMLAPAIGYSANEAIRAHTLTQEQMTKDAKTVGEAAAQDKRTQAGVRVPVTCSLHCAVSRLSRR